MNHRYCLAKAKALGEAVQSLAPHQIAARGEIEEELLTLADACGERHSDGLDDSGDDVIDTFMLACEAEL